jgi:hypothetical protein
LDLLDKALDAGQPDYLEMEVVEANSSTWYAVQYVRENIRAGVAD